MEKVDAQEVMTRHNVVIIRTVNVLFDKSCVFKNREDAKTKKGKHKASSYECYKNKT